MPPAARQESPLTRMLLGGGEEGGGSRVEFKPQRPWRERLQPLTVPSGLWGPRHQPLFSGEGPGPSHLLPAPGQAGPERAAGQGGGKSEADAPSLTATPVGVCAGDRGTLRATALGGWPSAPGFLSQGQQMQAGGWQWPPRRHWGE